MAPASMPGNNACNATGIVGDIGLMSLCQVEMQMELVSCERKQRLAVMAKNCSTKSLGQKNCAHSYRKIESNRHRTIHVRYDGYGDGHDLFGGDGRGPQASPPERRHGNEPPASLTFSHTTHFTLPLPFSNTQSSCLPSRAAASKVWPPWPPCQTMKAHKFVLTTMQRHTGLKHVEQRPDSRPTDAVKEKSANFRATRGPEGRSPPCYLPRVLPPLHLRT